MSMLHDRQVRGYLAFQAALAVVLVCCSLLWGMAQMSRAHRLYTAQQAVTASALLEQGLSRQAAAQVLCGQTVTPQGRELLAVLGMDSRTAADGLPGVALFQQTVWAGAALAAGLAVVLLAGTGRFLWRRDRLYQQAVRVLNGYMHGDFTQHLPRDREGTIFQLFFAAEQLATMLRAKNETEHKAREFLKSTISDISHQLKTPLAALAMYQEIIQSEPDDPAAVRAFSAKIGASLGRMEQLIQSLLKITRLDAGSIVFEKGRHTAAELTAYALRDLTIRAQIEGKQITVAGDPEARLVCDLQWTAEALGNLVKNAIDHTGPGGHIRIAWERTPAMLWLTVCDDGDGIAPEDIHHIFKRFYRSRHALKTPGIGLGLPLARSIVEGQGGLLSVQSEPGQGTRFTLSFLTEV